LSVISEGIQLEIEDKLLGPYYALPGKKARYYQEIAINRAVQAVLEGKRRILLTLATGTTPKTRHLNKYH